MQPSDQNTEEAGGRKAPAWLMRNEGIGVALWTSFLVACSETMIIFAFLDPATLDIDALSPTLVALRPMLYGFGFLIFWAFAFISAAFTAYMLQSGPHAPPRSTSTADRERGS